MEDHKLFQPTDARSLFKLRRLHRHIVMWFGRNDAEALALRAKKKAGPSGPQRILVSADISFRAVMHAVKRCLR
jgi:hypothetical protein